MEEVWAGDSLVTFDGIVLEVFGFASREGRESVRFHVRNLDLSIGEPNRKGRRSALIKPATSSAGGIQLDVEEEDWPTVGPLLDRVLAAMPD